eukprot:3164724-Pyramimonas_sp.AAC.1
MDSLTSRNDIWIAPHSLLRFLLILNVFPNAEHVLGVNGELEGAVQESSDGQMAVLCPCPPSAQ